VLQPTRGRPRRPTPSRGDLTVTGIVLAWIAILLLTDAVRALDRWEDARQAALGVVTWLLLAVLLRRETPLVRAQTLAVVAIATAFEYTFSVLLGAYTYRIGTVPPFVPPGHGLVYLAALAFGRSPAVRAHGRALVRITLVSGAAWAAWGLLLAPRRDVLGAAWFGCLVGFLLWGRSRLLYVGAFTVVSYLELLGTGVGTWSWTATDPVLHRIGQGNPPSGAAGGYGWFDLYALLLAPHLLAATRRVASRLRAGRPRGQDGDGSPIRSSTSACSSPLVASALPPAASRSTPASEENRPPASTTIGIRAAMS
jgi:hypothetical protein